MNKQVHAEVSKVLYEENCWVLLRMDWREHNRLEDLQVQDKNGIHSRIQLPKVDGFLGTPNMEISLKHKDANPDRQLWSYVISAYSLPHLLRIIVQHFPSPDATLSIQIAPSVKCTTRATWTPKQLLGPFRDIRGLEVAIITGCDESLAKEVVTTMTKPFGNTRGLDPKEFHQRALVYLSLGGKYLEAKQYCKARDTFFEGAEYIRWLALNPFDKKKIQHNDDPSSDYQQLMNDTYKELSLSSIHCCNILGEARAARIQLHKLCEESGTYYRLTTSELTTCYVEAGNSYLLDDAWNAAAYSYLCGLLGVPGDVRTNQAVAALYDRVKEGLDPKHAIVKYNIVHVLEPLRLEVSSGDPCSNRQSEDICRGFGRGFVGEVREIQSLLAYQANPRVSSFAVREHGVDV